VGAGKLHNQAHKHWAGVDLIKLSRCLLETNFELLITIARRRRRSAEVGLFNSFRLAASLMNRAIDPLPSMNTYTNMFYRARLPQGWGRPVILLLPARLGCLDNHANSFSSNDFLLDLSIFATDMCNPTVDASSREVAD
jgi:hypothetical protein